LVKTTGFLCDEILEIEIYLAVGSVIILFDTGGISFSFSI